MIEIKGGGIRKTTLEKEAETVLITDIETIKIIEIGIEIEIQIEIVVIIITRDIEIVGRELMAVTNNSVIIMVMRSGLLRCLLLTL